MKKQEVAIKTTEETRCQTIAVLKKILPSNPEAPLTTETLAHALGVRPGTVRRGLCVSGHYLGLVPIKSPNGRLLWPLN